MTRPQSGSAEGRAELVQLERAHARARDELQKAELGERECELALQRSLAELAGLERIELARLEVSGNVDVRIPGEK